MSLYSNNIFCALTYCINRYEFKGKRDLDFHGIGYFIILLDIEVQYFKIKKKNTLNIM
jgi:hypothetical protein